MYYFFIVHFKKGNLAGYKINYLQFKMKDE